MDLVKRVKDFSDDDLNRQFQQIAKVLQDAKRGRETLDALRKLFQLMLLRDIQDLPSAMIQLLLRQETKAKLLSVLPLLLAAEEAFAINFDNLHFWLTGGSYPFKDICFPAMFIACRKYPHLLQSRHVRVLEAQCSTWVSNASKFSAKDPNAVSFLNLGGTKPTPVTEMDGSILRDFFTLLNVTAFFTEDQVYNIHSVGLLHTWTYYVHLRKPEIPKPLPQPPGDSQPTSDSPEIKRSVMDDNLKKNSVAYCLRMIEQAKVVLDRNAPATIKDIGDANSIFGLPSFEILAIIEAVRTIDLLCLVDRSIAPSVFGTFKKLAANVNRALSVTHPEADYSKASTLAQLVITLLVFFIHHGETMVYDVDPIFRGFLETYIGAHYDDSNIAFETLLFCATHKVSLLHNTNVLTAYFPPLLKLFAYNPEYLTEMKALLPCLLGATTFIELFHSLLDLPLLCAALIKIKQEEREPRDGVEGPLDPQSRDNSEYRVLYNYLLRNESGVTINWWSYNTTRPLIDLFCQETEASPHVEQVMAAVPPLLEIYFDVLISHGDQSCLSELLPLLFERVEQLYPHPEFEKSVHDVFISKLLAIFQKYPDFVCKHHGLLLSEIARNSFSRRHVILHVCYIIGEYATPTTCDSNILNDYDETLELLAFELMSSIHDHTDRAYANELMSVLISALAKICSRWPPLSSRVELCLNKLERYKDHFQESVIHRAYECLNLLKFPSIAAAIMAAGQPKQARGNHIDSASSIPFQLLPTGQYSQGRWHANHVPSRQPLHLFSI